MSDTFKLHATEEKEYTLHQNFFDVFKVYRNGTLAKNKFNERGYHQGLIFGCYNHSFISRMDIGH